MKVVFNPQRPTGSNVIGFIHDKYRVDLIAGEESEGLPDHVAEKILLTFGFLSEVKKKTVGIPPKAEATVPPQTPDGGEPKGTSLIGLAWIGGVTLTKLKAIDITTREAFFEKLNSDPELMKKVLGGVVYSKFV